MYANDTTTIFRASEVSVKNILAYSYSSTWDVISNWWIPILILSVISSNKYTCCAIVSKIILKCIIAYQYSCGCKIITCIFRLNEDSTFNYTISSEYVILEGYSLLLPHYSNQMLGLEVIPICNVWEYQLLIIIIVVVEGQVILKDVTATVVS